MPARDIAILTVICGLFFSFGVVLTWVSWYCRPGHHRQKQRHAHHVSSAHQMVIDD